MTEAQPIAQLVRAGVWLGTAVLFSACGSQPTPRPQQLHATPFQYLSGVQLGMRETELAQVRPVHAVAAGAYREELASYAVVYVTPRGRVAGVIVAQAFPIASAARMAYAQYQQEAYRSFGSKPKCAYDAGRQQRLTLYELKGEVFEVSLQEAGASAEVTRSFLLSPSVQWRRAQGLPCAR